MSHIAIVGGHGKVAQQLVPILVEAGHTPVALVRREEHRAEMEAAGARVRLVDLERAEAADLAAAFAGVQAVVFAAGGGADGNIGRKRTVDLEGSTKSAEGARLAGVPRFVQISAMGVDAPVAQDAEPVWRAYVEAKRDADAHLRDTGLDWTILRPGALTDGAATGRLSVGASVARGEISRADVALAVAAALEDPATVGLQVELVAGDTPVAEALSAAAGAGAGAGQSRSE